MASRLRTDHSIRAVALFAIQFLVLAFFSARFLLQFYATASVAEAGWSIVLMPMLLAFVSGLWAVAALPLAIAYAIHKTWAWLFVPASIALPFWFVTNARSGEFASVLITGDDTLLQALQWQMPLVVLIVSITAIFWLEYLAQHPSSPTSNHAGYHNE